MYSLRYEQNGSLPKLAWLAVISRGDPVVRIICGPKVECRESSFVTGVWDGDFEGEGFDTSEVFFGTGAKLTKNGIDFVTPSHSLERLVLTDDGKTVTVSNSVPFLMQYNGLEPDRRIDQYERMMCSMLDGPQKMQRTIPMSGGRSFDQFIVSIITVGTDGSVSVRQRNRVRPYTDFNNYFTRLSSAMERMRENSVSKLRKHGGFGIISTISSGYDSLTASFIAKTIGCDTVVGLSGGQYDIDNGTDAARQMGYKNIIMRDMLGYRDLPDCIDAEFLASGEMGTMLQFRVFEDLFKDNLVFFGLRGSYWDKHIDMTDDFEMIGYFNCEADVSVTETALRNGYICIPLPTYGASAVSSVCKVTNSEEMTPWTLGTSYDKPIPRRILETHGVAREAFGQKKYGGGFSFYRDNKKRLSKRMSKEGYRAFTEFRKSGKGIKRGPARAAHRLRYVSLNLPSYLSFLFGKLHIPIRLRQKPNRYANPGIVADLFFWGVELTKSRYKKALDKGMKSAVD